MGQTGQGLGSQGGVNRLTTGRRQRVSVNGRATAMLAGLLVLAAAAAPSISPAAEQKYPVRPVRLVVTVPPGGAADFVARVVGQKLGESRGQTFVVDNRSGGGGHIAGEVVARSAPDGHTLLLGSSTTHGIGPHIYPRLPYDPMRDLAPVTLLATMPMIMVVNAQPVAPDAPTMAEVGLPGVGGIIWYGIMVPAGTPKEAVARLDGEANRIVRTPEVIERMAGVGVDAAGSTPASFATFIREEFEKWGPAVRSSGAKAE